MSYVDIKVQKTQEAHTYLVAATTRGGKLEQETFQLSPETWHNVEPSLSALKAREATAHDHVQKVRDFGKYLFNRLISGNIRHLYDDKKQDAIRNKEILRLQLTLEPLELVVLPWELLFDERVPQYLCLTEQPKTVLIRSIKEGRPSRRPCNRPSLNIVGMVADPRDLPVVGEREKHTIEQAFKPLIDSGKVTLTWKPGKYTELLDLKHSGDRVDIFHFIGHGRFDENSRQGYLEFEDDKHSTKSIPAENFPSSLPTTTKLVVLNACETARGDPFKPFSNIAHSLVSKGIPAVVAMQFKILDSASHRFAKTFYTCLAGGRTIDEAIAEARYDIRNTIDELDSLDWVAPLIYVSSPYIPFFKLTNEPTLSHQPTSSVVKTPVTTNETEKISSSDVPISSNLEQEDTPASPPEPVIPQNGGQNRPPGPPAPNKQPWRNRALLQWKALPRWAQIVSPVVLMVLILALVFGLVFGPGFLENLEPPTSLCLATNLPTSGPVGTTGQDIQDGVTLAYTQSPLSATYHGYQLKMHFMDDTSKQQGGRPSAAQGVNNLNQLFQQHDCPNPIAVIGPYDSPGAAAEIPLAAQDHLLLLSPSNTTSCLTKKSYSDPHICNYASIHPQGLSNTYARLPRTDEDQGYWIANFLLASPNSTNPEQGGLGAKKVEIVGDEEIYGTGISQAVIKELGINGVKLSIDCVKLPDEYSKDSSCSLNPGTKAFSIQNMGALAAKIQAAQPDAIFFGGRNDRGAGLLRQQLGTRGVGQVPFVGASALVADKDAFFRVIGLHAENIYATFPGADPSTFTSGAAATFSKEYQRTFNRTPGAYSANGYDAANIILQTITGLVDAHKPVTRDSVAQAVLSSHFTGVAGNSIVFDQNGDNIGQQVYTIYRSQQGASGVWDWKVLQRR